LLFAGTHLYVLYEGYGFSVASLYCLGFFTGAVTAPVTGPMIDRFGRKKMALLYCALEVGINSLEQFPFLSGLIVSRMVGGITTNLLSTVFEAWADTEYRKRGFSDSQYETLMRDSVVVSNLAAIASGYLAHVLAEAMGPKGPFEGAVTCTALAFGVVFFLWSENYGSSRSSKASVTNAFLELKDTVNDIKADSRILRVCITQGLTMGSLHIFIFLWSPVLKDYAMSVHSSQFGLDAHGEPAYGLIFGAFMAAGVVGGLCSPSVRKMVTLILSPLTKSTVPEVVTVDGEGEVRPMAVEFQAATCYILCAILLFVPVVLNVSDPSSFGIALFSFFCYEILVGVYFPCEGVIRSIYMPPGARGSMMTIPRIIVNLAVALGVISTEWISRQTAMGIMSLLMLISGCLQLTLISKREWQSLFGRIEEAKRKSLIPLQSFSSSMIDFVSTPLSTKETVSRASTPAVVEQVPAPNLLACRPKTE
jgi:MFS family permease